MRGVPVKTPERVAEAIRLRDEGLSLREIADRMNIDVRPGTIHAWIADPDGARLHARKQSYRGACEGCGAATDGSNGPGNASRFCLACCGDAYAIWTCDAIVCAIQEWADEHGGIPPSSTDWVRARASGDDRVCSVSQVQRQFVTWNAAIRAAGLEPHAIGPVGGWHPLTPAQRRLCARRYAAGDSSAVIAADLGCSTNAVLKWVRHAGVPVRDLGRRAAA